MQTKSGAEPECTSLYFSRNSIHIHELKVADDRNKVADDRNSATMWLNIAREALYVPDLHMLVINRTIKHDTHPKFSSYYDEIKNLE